MQKTEYKIIIEALLFASPDPLTQAKVNSVFDSDSPNLVEVVENLNSQYKKEKHAFEIRSVAGGFQLVSRDKFEYFIRRMLNKSGRLTLSPAALDSLAIIAYKQPIGRYEIEAIRGVDSSGVLKTLLTRNLIIIKGRDSGPGRPLLYQTTVKFLEHFGLNRISDMPKLKEITDLMEADPTLGEQIAVFEENEPESNNESQSPKIKVG
ncbi:MAG: SMC-Scp complex subunit ScpB [Candidatus Marinimicrobia bacterium]|jgi:segregation and condensation protein B|nr:SMC-Scp complex subunit ScpB [Candidatus Neomarinimicrobiota bacterium]MBT3501900.1 SMC-Scp complex subunit ScpB [Candidatus Neomarinimicrobiota bacterium]MBT3838574.1 SMC-Scp complex subunit ScpB [Candidatus Neomarinimicrobiota bacterium]MBT3999812.1 SMC-Scp complex subunit ScpB [Candidatus Neomarinimicrobiota bacterium]MBT4281867.1 SMC-Scp complex subunit ScpB [Candidatus Neomarinimicrobiota bacterium]